MTACLALPPLPQQLLDTASHIYGEFAPNSSTSSWQTALRVDEPSLLRFHVAPIDVDVDATVLHARDGEVATSARDGVGHEELLLLPLAVANEYTLLLRFSGAQRSDCPALRIEASLTPARLLRGRLLELNAACPAEPMYPELDLAPLEAHRPVTLRPVPPSMPSSHAALSALVACSQARCARFVHRCDTTREGRRHSTPQASAPCRSH